MTGTDWLDQLEQKAAAATAGPWSVGDGQGDWDAPLLDHIGDYIGASPDDGVRAGFNLNDAEFIAAANPHTVQRLINEVRRLEQECGDLAVSDDDSVIRMLTTRLDEVQAERDALAAKVARVEALAADYETGTYWAFGRALRAALSDGSDQ